MADNSAFHVFFNSEIKDIHQAKGVEKNERAQRLRTQVSELSHVLPSYQQQKYSEALLALQGSAEHPKRRFQFSKRVRTQQKQQMLKTFDDQEVKPTVSGARSTHLDITDKIPSISDISHCTVRISGASTVSLKDVKECTLVIESSGPVFIRGASDSLFFINCHQLRIHDSTNTKIHANIPSGRAVIEGCHGLQVQGVLIDDFDHPNGMSTSYTTVEFDSEILDRASQIPLAYS